MKANSKKPNKYLMIIGVVLITAGVFLGLSYNNGIPAKSKINTSDEMKSLIESIFPYVFREEGFKIEAVQNGNNYDLYINFAASKFRYDAWCGYEGIDFIKGIKLSRSDLDEKIVNYYFTFIADTKITYTTKYFNDPKKSIYDINIALDDGDKLLPAKNDLQYLKEKETLIFDPKEFDTLEGKSFIIIVNENNSYSVQPKNETDKIRESDSSLMKYEAEYCSQYFKLNNVSMDKSDYVINITIQNTSKFNYKYISIKCDYLNSDGDILYRSKGSVQDLEAGKSSLLQLKYYGTSKDIDNFKITQVYFYPAPDPGKTIVFD